MLRYFILLRNKFQIHKRFNGKEYKMETDLIHQVSSTFRLIVDEMFKVENNYRGWRHFSITIL